MGCLSPLAPSVLGRYTVQLKPALPLVVEKEPLELKLETLGKPVPVGLLPPPLPPPPGFVANAAEEIAKPRATAASLSAGAFIEVFLLSMHYFCTGRVNPVGWIRHAGNER